MAAMATKTENKMAYNVRELAQMLGIGVNNAYDLAHSEGFPCVWVSARRCIIPADGLRRWLDEQAAGSDAGPTGKAGGRLGVL